MTSQASAFLFCNGNAVYLDEHGEQLVDMQKHGWSGLHLFDEMYPSGTVQIQNGDVPEDIKPYILKNIKYPWV